MINWRGYLPAFTLSFLLVLFTACGGGSGVVDDGLDDTGNDDPVPTGQWTGTAATSASVDLAIEGVPEIPFDGYDHQLSETATHELPGNEYIQMYNAVVDGTDLVLTAPADAPVDGYPISYGLYRFAGLADVEPQWLNIECMPEVLGDEYFVGLADYTAGDWRWFGPVTFPEFQLDMSDLLHHVVTELGNMYVIVLCRDGNSATISRLVLTVEDGGGDDPGLLPGAPHHLVATDGVYDEMVVIEWESGIGADSYELWRQYGEGDWGLLAGVEGNRYEDTEVVVGDLYNYKAFAVNEYGTSAHSNIDSGYAGELGGGGDGELPAPHEIWASDGTHTDHVVVEWGYEGDYNYFELWRRPAEAGEYEYLASIDGENFRYEDYEVVPGTVYKYKVRAIYGEVEGPFSDYDTGYAAEEGGGDLPAPHEIWASDGAHTDHVVIEWGYSGDYDYFELWRRPAEAGEFEYLASIDGENFRYEDYEVTPGTVYKYKVRAIYGEVEGPFSEYDTGYAEGGGGELPAPHEIWASDGAHTDHVVIEWGYSGDYDYFELWRRPEAEGEFAYLDSLDGENFRYEDYEVVPGTVYKYKVRAIYGEQEGPFSDYDTGYAEGGGEIPVPFELWASDGLQPDHVVVEWGCEGDWAYFDLWRRVAEGGEWGRLTAYDDEAMRYEDYDVDPGTVYEYKVRVILGVQEGGWSNTDTGYAEGGSGVSAPFELVASKGLYLEKIRVEWSHAGDYDYFELWRKQDGEGHEWALIAEIEAMGYDDTELPGDYTFIYKARAVLGEALSEFSNTDFGYLQDNPETCLIDVVLRHGEEGRWGGVPVVLYGLEEPVVHETNENGLARFDGLSRGLYLVVPMHREIAFDPVWQLVDLREGTTGREVFFAGVIDEMQAFRLRGVVYDFAGVRELNRFLPLGGVTVHIAQVGTENTWTVETDEAGYWTLPEMVIGSYHVWAEYEGYIFTPEIHDPAVDGINLPDRGDFRGYPVE